MYELINEMIYVDVEFSQKGLKPKSFTWKNKIYQIEEISFSHQSKDGNSTLTHFSVSDKINAYKITFNSKNLTWTLDEIYTDGFIKSPKLNDSPAYRF